MDSSVEQVREQALANFDALLDYWNLNYKKITEYEYDIIATWRKDNDYGGCRFNLGKARGADFAGGGLSRIDIEDLHDILPFDKEDYAGYTPQGQGKTGFDIVGLAQRVHKCPNYKDAIGHLSNDLTTIAQYRTLYTPTSDAAMRRAKENEARIRKSKQLANDMWGSCKFHKFEGSVAEKYLANRGITVKDENMRSHPGIMLGKRNTYPALIFKVQKEPFGPLVAIHRIYLSKDGQKANIPNPKMALAPVKGNAIWLGKKGGMLCLTEGPENALTLRQIGYDFVCSSIFGGNLHNISIPNYVKTLRIFPDPDKAGMQALDNAIEVYGKLKIKVEGRLPKTEFDLNDCWRMGIDG